MVSRTLDKEKLWKNLKRLSPQEKNVLILRFDLRGKGRKTQKEIAKKMGISRSLENQSFRMVGFT